MLEWSAEDWRGYNADIGIRTRALAFVENGYEFKIPQESLKYKTIVSAGLRANL